METIVITMEEFLAKIAAPKGIMPVTIEGQAKRELECGQDWSIFVGSQTMYVVKLESLRSYFEAKAAPAPVKSADPESFKDFMEQRPEKPEEDEEPEQGEDEPAADPEPEPEKKPKESPKGTKAPK